MTNRAFSAGWAAIPVALVVGTVALGLASPARADDPLPLPLVPPGMTAPPGVIPPATDAPDTIATELPGPTQSLSPPSQQQIDDARAALDRLKKAGRTASPHTEVAAPTASSSVTSRLGDQAWWTIAAGLLVLVVASETTRVSVRRAKHRKAE